MASRGLAKRPNKREAIETFDNASASAIPPARIAGAIRGYLLRDFVRVDLYRASNGEKLERLDKWDLTGKVNAEALASEILIRAKDDAETYGGRHRFALRFYEKDNPLSHAAQRTFVVNAEGDPEDDDTPRETKNADGTMAQAMRLLESQARMYCTAMGDVLVTLTQSNESLRQENENLREQASATAELREKLMSEEHMRIIEMNREARKDQIVGKGLELFTKYTPVMLSKFATGGKKGERPPPMLAEENVKNVLTSITSDPEYLARVAGALKPEDMAILAEIAGTYAQKEEETKKPEPPKSNGAPS